MTQPLPEDGATLTGLVIDFTRTWWGHNLEISQGKDGLLRGFVWNRTVPKLGDALLWLTEYGRAEGVLREVEWTGNVDDMYRVTVEVIERRSQSGEILWQITRDEGNRDA